MTSDDAAGQSKLSFPRSVTFAAASFALAATAISISVYLPQHFVKNLGLELTVVGTAFALVRLIDIPLDPLLGLAMDRTRTRWGRYRVWLVIGAPTLMLAVYMLFMARQGVGQGYLIGWLLVMYLATSMVGLAHAAWAAKLATTYEDRARLFGVMGAVGVTGSVLVLTMPMLARAFGMDDDAVGVHGMGWFILAAVPLGVLLVVTRTPETIAPVLKHHRFQLREYGRLVFRPTMGRIVLADLVLALAPGWESALWIFFATDYLGFTPAGASLILMASVAAGFLGAPFWARVGARIGKHRGVLIAAVGYSVGVFSLTLIPKGNLAVGLFVGLTTGFILSGTTVLLRAMTADVADEIRLEQGRERSGVLYALTSTTNKIAGAFSIWLTFSLLAKVAYNPALGSANTADATQGLGLVYLSGPIFFAMVGAFCMLGYDLGPAKVADIRRRLAELDQQARAHEDKSESRGSTSPNLAEPAQN